MIFVTGGAGFIGSNFVSNWLKNNQESVLVIDCLTYAGNLQNLDSVSQDPRYNFNQLDIRNLAGLRELISLHKPTAIINFAAESHVDRSIESPDDFIQTNIVGTYNLLQVSKEYWSHLKDHEKSKFRFLHISTDEVYGSLTANDPAFTEKMAYAPNSPYSASKAASDHLVRSYFHTYGLPVITTNCSNNYGPFQFPEKLIPLMIHNALAEKHLPIYGDGSNIRDWLYVVDHCDALELVLKNGRLGEVYNIGGGNEMKNIDTVDLICNTLDKIRPRKNLQSYALLKKFVKDRPGHDQRYAINSSKITSELGWKPKESFFTGLEKTIHWYLDNQLWVNNITSGAYKDWINANYGGRL